MRLGCFGAAAGGDGHSSAEVTDASGTLGAAAGGDGHSSAEVTDASGRFGAAAGGDGHSSAEVTENRVAGMLWCVLRREVAFQSLQCTLKHTPQHIVRAAGYTV